MSQNRTIAFHTLGCKLNFAETSSIGRTLTEAGYQKADFDSGADVVLINTCSVTENADRECRSIVNRAMALNSESIIIVTGCFAQLKPESVASIPGVDLVLGAGEKFKVEEYLSQLTSKGPALIHSCEIGEVNTFTSSWSAGDRTRVFLKVQDGCDYSCTFCTIPMARGASRSQWPEQVLQNVQEIVAGGAKEIVLTGINLGDYGIMDTASGKRESSFGELVEMLDELHAPVRFRISSIEPNLLHDDIIRRVARSDSFMPHFHIPLQSGSDEVLKRMRRRYLTALYADRVQTIRQQMPHACIGVDVITGFPGETEEHFKETQRFLADLDISYLHVFTYSERDNTPAADFDGSVPPAVRKDRTRMLRALSLRKQRAFYESQLGSVRTVLFEADQKKGFMHGYTDNYVKVKVPYDPSLINSLRECRLEMVDADGDVMVTILEPVTA